MDRNCPGRDSIRGDLHKFTFSCFGVYIHYCSSYISHRAYNNDESYNISNKTVCESIKKKMEIISETQ